MGIRANPTISCSRKAAISPSKPGLGLLRVGMRTAPQHRLAAVQRLCDTEGVQDQPSDTGTVTEAKRGGKAEFGGPPHIIEALVVA